MVTFRQLEILFGFTMEKEPWNIKEKNSKGSCQHLLCKESHWTINEGEVKLLDMGIKPIISRTRMGRRSEEIGHSRELMPLLEQLQAYKLESNWTREGLLHQLLLPNPELTTVLGGTTLIQTPCVHLVGHEADLQEEEPELDRAEDRAEAQAEDGVQEALDLGEPECYYFEEYEAPRMNPSVVAATRGLDFSKSSTNGKGKPLRRCKSPWTRW
ncbi:unnamed protein product [Microthlaspi erraticum]|uniref:Uncharacterized protein n=1 Tax=Microthlaspi erraticum TaxID=1685480 RepID=A0A6D2K325_9BRAS|nr:unnamed protein product [Microthlaspi erraticum]